MARGIRSGTLGRFAAGVAALVALATALGGLPYVLVVVAGSPVPSDLPSLSEMWTTLSSPDRGTLFLGALKVTAWLAWATFAISVAVEIPAQIRGRRTVRLPGLGLQQRLASVLVAAILGVLLTPTAAPASVTGTPPPAVAVSAPVVTETPVPTTDVGATTSTTDGTLARFGSARAHLLHQVVLGDSLLSVAEQYGVAWEDLAQANYGVLQPDGRSLTPNQHRIYPGWTLRVPSGSGSVPSAEVAAGTYTVAKHDWLGRIAERYLGDFNRYPEIAKLNPELVTDPDHIEPTWRLRLPADAYDRGVLTHATGTVEGGLSLSAPGSHESIGGKPEPPATPSTAAPPPATSPPATSPPATPPPATSPPVTSAPAPSPESSAAPAGEIAPSAGATAPPSLDVGDSPEEADMIKVAIAFGAASLLVALALAAVLRLRRRARQHHIDGHRPVPPEAAAIEAELRVAQEPLDVERLEQALRSLASGLAGRDGELPDPFGAVVDHGNVWLMLTEACPDPPQPWLEHGKSWLLPVDAQVPDASGEIAPLPTLAAVGWQEATHLLLDLERVGYVNVRGDSAARGNLLRYLASELALNSWSDDIELTLAGFPIHEAELLIALNPDRVRAASSITEAATRIAKRIETARATLAHTGVSDALAGRVSDTAADAWMPQVLIVSDPDDAGMAALADLSTALDRAGRCGISVVVGAPSDAPTYDRWTLTVNADGSLGLPFPVPGPPVNTAGLPVSELERLAQLMQTARSSAEIAVPPAAEPERWADGTDAGGGLLEPPPPTGPIEETTAMPDAGHDASNDSDKDQQRVVVTAAIPAEGPRRVITAAIRQRRRQTDPHLDDDLAAWRQRDPSRPRIGILGPVTVEAPGIQPEQRQRFHAEIIVYLAQRGARGADRDQLDAALWPDRVVKDASRRVAITRARRWLGETPDGEQWLPEMGADRVYRLREGYLVDWHLFRRLRARGEAHGSAGVKDLRAALELVRGVPLDGADRPYAAGGRNPYTWLAESDIHPEHITAAIVDTAHRLAQLCLQADDTAGARWAAAQAWLADPSRGYDQPWRDLLLSHHRDGREAELRATFAELMRARDAEVPEDLDPETFRLVLELLPDVVRSRQLVP